MPSEEYFDYLHLRFNLTQGRKLAKKYTEVERVIPSSWFPLPFLLNEPLPIQSNPLVATLAFNNLKTFLLIDGLQAKDEVRLVILDFSDTLQIITAPRAVKNLMKNQGQILGLL
jgi:hypothetical protein